MRTYIYVVGCCRSTWRTYKYVLGCLHENILVTREIVKGRIYTSLVAVVQIVWVRVERIRNIYIRPWLLEKIRSAHKVLISSLSLNKSLLVPYAYVSIKSTDCTILLLCELKVILLISSVKTLCFSLLHPFCIFNFDLLFL